MDQDVELAARTQWEYQQLAVQEREDREYARQLEEQEGESCGSTPRSSNTRGPSPFSGDPGTGYQGASTSAGPQVMDRQKTNP